MRDLRSRKKLSKQLGSTEFKRAISLLENNLQPALAQTWQSCLPNKMQLCTPFTHVRFNYYCEFKISTGIDSKPNPKTKQCGITGKFSCCTKGKNLFFKAPVIYTKISDMHMKPKSGFFEVPRACIKIECFFYHIHSPQKNRKLILRTLFRTSNTMSTP